MQAESETEEASKTGRQANKLTWTLRISWRLMLVDWSRSAPPPQAPIEWRERRAFRSGIC